MVTSETSHPAEGSAESLIREIRKQAEAEVQAILNAAREERKKILRQAKKEADEAKTGRLSRAEIEAALVRRKIESGVELEKQRTYLAAREKVIQEVVSRLETKFNTFRKSTPYHETLTQWIEEGASAVGEVKMHLIVGVHEKKVLNQKMLDTIARRLGGNQSPALSLHAFPDTGAEGGVMIQSEDGRITFDNRFSARLRRFESEIRREVGEMLKKD